MNRFLCAASLWALAICGWALGPESIGTARGLAEGLYFPVNMYDDSWVLGDQNGDERVDYAMQIDESGAKIFEAIDFNDDGYMDDFYIYGGGVLVRREIDQTFAGRINLWVYLSEGVYVQGYELDTSGDGIIDSYKEFGE